MFPNEVSKHEVQLQPWMKPTKLETTRSDESWDILSLSLGLSAVSHLVKTEIWRQCLFFLTKQRPCPDKQILHSHSGRSDFNIDLMIFIFCYFWSVSGADIKIDTQLIPQFVPKLSKSIKITVDNLVKTDTTDQYLLCKVCQVWTT